MQTLACCQFKLNLFVQPSKENAVLRVFHKRVFPEAGKMKFFQKHFPECIFHKNLGFGLS